MAGKRLKNISVNSVWLFLVSVHGQVVPQNGGLVADGVVDKALPRSASALAVREDIQRRVAVAGGNSFGLLVASLSWATPDDLDLHVVAPGGEISYRNRRVANGELDVDMCVQGGRSKYCTQRPVENVVFADVAPKGRYRVYVQNYNFHQNILPEDQQVARMQEQREASKEERKLRLGRDRPVLFDLLVKVEESYKLFRGYCTPVGKTHEQSNTAIFEFDYAPEAKSPDERLVVVSENTQPNPACTEYQNKIEELSAPLRAKRAINGGNFNHLLPPGEIRQKDQQTVSATSPRSTVPGRGKGSPSKKKRRSNDKKIAALNVLRAASRDILVNKPSKVLKELMNDLGEVCKGCLEKGEIVDKLLKVADARRGSQEL